MIDEPTGGERPDRVPILQRLRTRLMVLGICSGVVVAGCGAIGLHYVDAVARATAISSEITAPLVSDALTLSQAGQKARTLVEGAGGRCEALDVAQRGLADYSATADRLLAGMSRRAAAAGAAAELRQLDAVEDRFVGVGEEMIAACLRRQAIGDALVRTNDLIVAILGDLSAILGEESEVLDREMTALMPTPGDFGAATAVRLDDVRRRVWPLARDLGRLRAGLGAFVGVGERTQTLTTTQAVAAARRDTESRLDDLDALAERTGATLEAEGRGDQAARLRDYVADLAAQTIGSQGLLEHQQAFVDVGQDLDAMRVRTHEVDEAYFTALSRLESVTRRLDAEAHAQATGRTLEAFRVVAATVAVVLLIALGTAIFVARRVTKPIERLTRHVRVLRRDGDLGQAMEPRLLGRGDEIGLLARSFDRLVAELREARRRLVAESEAELAHLAHTDQLTGLPNRVGFQEALDGAVKRLDGDRQVALLVLDIDHFKTVNDTLGHSVGDRLLQAVAGRIGEAVGESGTVARLGGDEFAVVCEAAIQPIAATTLAERLIARLGEPYDIGGHAIVVGASVGIAVAPEDAREADRLAKCADLALDRAKREGPGVHRFFEVEMDVSMQRRRILETDLRRAVVNGEFEVYYQPLVGARSERIAGFEALLRWNHPTRGLVSPADFIPLAEETGLIGTIGAWVMREAACEAARWPTDLHIAVNISPIQFKNRALALDVLAALGASGLPAGRLELEITEGVLLTDTEATLETLDQLREIGVRIAMDDFGTGYSSLSYLSKFAFDKVKIDQSFVRDLEKTADSLAIIRAVTGLCSSLGIVTTAEGVETDAQRDRLRAEGCTQLQGYLFGRPMPATAARRLVEQGPERLSA